MKRPARRTGVTVVFLVLFHWQVLWGLAVSGIPKAVSEATRYGLLRIVTHSIHMIMTVLFVVHSIWDSDSCC